VLHKLEGSMFVIAHWCLKIYRYHLKDVIIGKIYFLLVRIKLKNMDLEIRRRESTGSGANTHVETETLAKFELMDGAPVRGMLKILLFILIFQPI
jgi:vacuolar protein sorting-associated protein 26